MKEENKKKIKLYRLWRKKEGGEELKIAPCHCERNEYLNIFLKCKSSWNRQLNFISKMEFLISFFNHIQIVLFACVALAVADVSELDSVVRFDSVVNPDSYNYAYETSKGIQAEESGVLKNAGSEQEAIVSSNCFLNSSKKLNSLKMFILSPNRKLKDHSHMFHPKVRTLLSNTLPTN